jgi:hypothetical protein
MSSEIAHKQCYAKAEPARQSTRKRLAHLQAAEVRQGVHGLSKMPKSLPQPRAELHGGHTADVDKKQTTGLTTPVAGQDANRNEANYKTNIAQWSD